MMHGRERSNCHACLGEHHACCRGSHCPGTCAHSLPGAPRSGTDRCVGATCCLHAHACASHACHAPSLAAGAQVAASPCRPAPAQPVARAGPQSSVMRCAGVSKLQAQLAELRKPPHCRLPPAAPAQTDPAKARQAPAPAQLGLGHLVDFEEHEADELAPVEVGCPCSPGWRQIPSAPKQLLLLRRTPSLSAARSACGACAPAPASAAVQSSEAEGWQAATAPPEAAAAQPETRDAFEGRHLVNMGPPVSLPLTHISAADEVR